MVRKMAKTKEIKYIEDKDPQICPRCGKWAPKGYPVVSENSVVVSTMEVCTDCIKKGLKKYETNKQLNYRGWKWNPSRRKPLEAKDPEPEPKKTVLPGDRIAGKRMAAVETEDGTFGLLGHVLAYTVGNCLVREDTIARYWEDFAINERYIPLMPTAGNAFRRAVKTLEKEKRDRRDDTIKKIYEITSLGEDTYMYSMKKVKYDGKKKRTMKTKNMLRVSLVNRTLDDKSEADWEVVVEKINGMKDEKVAKTKRKVQKKFKLFLNNIASRQIRSAVKRMVRDNSGVNFTMGKGGAYFVPVFAEEQVLLMKEFLFFVHRFHRQGEHPVEMRTLPVFDVEDQKEMIKADVEKMVKKRLEEIYEEAIGLLESTEPNKLQEKLEKKLKKHKLSQDMLGRYTGILKTGFEVSVHNSKTERDKNVSNLEDKEGNKVSGRIKGILEQLSIAKTEVS